MSYGSVSYMKFSWTTWMFPLKTYSFLTELYHRPTWKLPAKDTKNCWPATVTPSNMVFLCKDFVGGIDLALLGVDGSGHIGLNDTAASPKSSTRLIYLDTKIRVSLASTFFGQQNVPTQVCFLPIDSVIQLGHHYGNWNGY